MERDDLYRRARRGVVDGRQRHAVGSAATFCGDAIAGVVHEDAAHHHRGQPKKLGAVVPVDISLIDQARIGLVDEGRGLESVIAALPSHECPREASKLFVHYGLELFGCFDVAAARLDQ